MELYIHSWSRPERDCPEIQTPGGRPWPCQLGRVFTWPHAFPFLLRETDRPLVSVCACTTPPLFGFRNLPLYSAVQKAEGYVQNGPVSSSISRGCFGASVENLDWLWAPSFTAGHTWAHGDPFKSTGLGNGRHWPVTTLRPDLVVQLLTVFLSSCSLQPLFIWPAVPQASVCHIQLCFHLPFHPFTPPPSICQRSHHPSDCWFVCPHLLPSRHMGLTPSAGPSVHPFLRLSVAHTFVSPVTRQAAESTDWPSVPPAP